MKRSAPVNLLPVALLVAVVGACQAPPAAGPPAGSATPRPQADPGATEAPAAAAARPFPGSFALFGQLPGQTDDGPAAAGDLRQMTFAPEGSDFDPAIDPTGKLLVFASTRHRTTSDLCLQRVDGAAVTQLTDDPANDAMPVFSPDGRRIAFCSDRAGNWDLYVMPAPGGLPARLTAEPSQDVHPWFSPDGKQLVYCSQPAQGGPWEIVVLDLENPARKRYLTQGLFPVWSPTDSRIAFQRSRGRGTRWFSVWTIDVAQGEPASPTEIAASSNAACINPRFSPDGRRLVFATVLNPEGREEAAQSDLWVIGADGSGRTNLMHNGRLNAQPIWASDGAIYFVSGKTRAAQSIWALKSPRTLLTNHAIAAAPATQPAAAPAPDPPAPGPEVTHRPEP